MSSPSAVLPWQLELWRVLAAALQENRLSHALLLAGPEGVGKRPLARMLASALLCEARQADATACGTCRSCALLAAGNHPDLMWLTREYDEKADKEKRDISMDQLRATIERLGLASHYQQARIVVIDPAEALNVSGVNAVLKTVEEPPPGSYVFLISERPNALAPTLRSRCQRLRCALPERAVAEQWLKQSGHAEAVDVLGEAGGAPLRAVEWLRSGQAAQRRGWRESWMRIAHRQASPLAAASAVKKEEIRDWLASFQGFLTELLRGRWRASDDPAVAALSGRVTTSAIEQLQAETGEALRRFSSNPNPQLLAESLMILWWRHAGLAP